MGLRGRLFVGWCEEIGGPEQGLEFCNVDVFVFSFEKSLDLNME